MDRCMSLLSTHCNVLNNQPRLVGNSPLVNHSPAPLNISILLCTIIFFFLHIETHSYLAHSTRKTKRTLRWCRLTLQSLSRWLVSSNPLNKCCNKPLQRSTLPLTIPFSFSHFTPPPASRSKSVDCTTPNPRRPREKQTPLKKKTTRLDMSSPRKALNRPKKRTLVRWDGVCPSSVPDVESCLKD